MEDSEGSANIVHMKNSFMFRNQTCIVVKHTSLNLNNTILYKSNGNIYGNFLFNFTWGKDDAPMPEEAAKCLVIPLANHKEFKKLLRSKTNMMVIFVADVKKPADVSAVVGEASSKVRGLATCITIDCITKEDRKICKKMKVRADSYLLRHYKK